MFKRKGVYYALFGKCCCFCVGGSGETVYTATNPMGPYVERGNIGCNETVPVGCGCTATQPQPSAASRNPYSIAAGQAAAAVANGPPHCPSSAASVTHSQ